MGARCGQKTFSYMKTFGLPVEKWPASIPTCVSKFLSLVDFASPDLPYEAKLCILRILSGFHNKDAPIVLLLFFYSL